MWEAVFGLAGAVIGAVISAHATQAAVRASHQLEHEKQERIDAPRRALLLEMLNNPPPGKEWRKLETLSKVIGAERYETTRLLIQVGARGSTDEADVWALKSKKPLSGAN